MTGPYLRSMMWLLEEGEDRTAFGVKMAQYLASLYVILAKGGIRLVVNTGLKQGSQHIPAHDERGGQFQSGTEDESDK